MKRLKILLFIFFIAISVPLAFVIWQTYDGLGREERGQLEFFAEALFDQMELELADLVQSEENRAVDEYQHFLAQPVEKDQRSLQVSPLAGPVYQEYILGYLQNNPDGSFQTPLVADMGQVPEDRRDTLLQLKEANQIFNSRKYSLPRQKTLETEMDESETAAATVQDSGEGGFATRYLTQSKRLPEKVYLGKKQRRVEEISAEQVLNVASEDDSFKESTLAAGKGKSNAPYAAAPEAVELKADNRYDVARSVIVDADKQESQTGFTELADSRTPQTKFQVEVAPFQSVSIKDTQVYIFRLIAINNQLYRQGFILLVKPLLEHLVTAHFDGQPLADYSMIELQRRDLEKDVTTIRAGVTDGSARFITRRIFPAPFDFLSVTLKVKTIPQSPARESLRMAIVVLGIFMVLGLLTIYQSARTIVAMSERRSQFVSSVTHELKTPLTNIRMYIEMLEQGIAATPEREQEYLAIVNSESTRLSSLINNVLELAKLEKKQRQFHMEEGRLSDVLTEVQRVMGEKLEQEGFILEVQASDVPYFSFDRDVLIQIMINLIENSIKFGRHSPIKTITVKADRQSRDIRIAVCDTGPGIPRNALKKIFEDFYRADNDLTRSTGGTGIGLALVKKFVIAMGGHVSAANNKGPGCTITLLFPS